MKGVLQDPEVLLYDYLFTQQFCAKAVQTFLYLMSQSRSSMHLLSYTPAFISPWSSDFILYNAKRIIVLSLFWFCIFLLHLGVLRFLNTPKMGHICKFLWLSVKSLLAKMGSYKILWKPKKSSDAPGHPGGNRKHTHGTGRSEARYNLSCSADLGVSQKESSSEKSPISEMTRVHTLNKRVH